MSTKTIKGILSQDYKTVKKLKSKPDLNYAEMYKQVLNKKQKNNKYNEK